jgi:hypothetical protein
VVRYPRALWEDVEGARYLFTTQVADEEHDNSRETTPGPLAGSICELSIAGGLLRCVGMGKAHGIIPAPELDRIFVVAWGFGSDGHGVVYELPRRPPLAVLRTLEVDEKCGIGWFDPESGVLALYCDEARWVHWVDAATLTETGRSPSPLIPAQLRWDTAGRRGVACFTAGPLLPIDGGPYLAAAITAEPPSERPLGSTWWAWLALSWGCDWDRERDEVHVAVATLGLLATIDQRTGDVRRLAWTGFGYRGVSFDARRRRAYLANFLRGDVIAVDVDTGRTVQRWFGGRFAREVLVTADGRHLLVGSNVGLVRIDLGG